MISARREKKANEVRLSNIISPAFYGVYNDFKNFKYTHYWLVGGRGSGKSSFAAICVVLGVMRGGGNAIVFRKTENKLRESVLEQVLWAVEKLGVENYWQKRLAPLELTFSPNGNRILFRGISEASRLKSIKTSAGHFAFVWFEEADEFSGFAEIRSVLQSVLRGDSKFSVFYSYNPPPMSGHWANSEALSNRSDKYLHRSTYLDMPSEWLGKAFITEAEYLKQKDYNKYRNEYLGETGTAGGEVFKNLTIRSLDDTEIQAFCNIRRGIDFGFAVDPFAYICLEYQKKSRRLIIFHEIYQCNLSNERAASLIMHENFSNDLVCADCAEPKSISELRSYGLRILPAKKGRDSIYYGIKFMQDLDEIIIDPVRCPNATREFTNYSYLPDKRDSYNGSYLPIFRDKDNHLIDAARYALESDMNINLAKIHDKRQFFGIF